MRRIAVGSASTGQPQEWTLLDFQDPEDQAEPLAAALSGGLLADGGWYVNCNTAVEAFVIFADRVFRYSHGDLSARSKVEEYARSVGVPEARLDWTD